MTYKSSLGKLGKVLDDIINPEKIGNPRAGYVLVIVREDSPENVDLVSNLTTESILFGLNEIVKKLEDEQTQS